MPNRHEQDDLDAIRLEVGETAPPPNWAWLDVITMPLDSDMIAAALDQPEQQERPALDQLFPEER